MRETMPWLQLRLQTTKQYAEETSDVLMDIGALSVTFMDAEDQPILEPAPGETPLWENVVIQALFEADIDTNEVLEQWKLEALSEHSQVGEFEILEDKDWEREWMDRFEPMCFGDRLWICPSWKPVVDENAVNILLDPGLAFGTGTHPTTALCLKWLDAADVNDKVVIDYGCGSGILAIAALKLGAKKVYAVDIDPQAILATKDNAERNNVADERLLVGMPEILKEKSQADILLANILAEPLRNLIQEIYDLCKPHGRIALSGLLTTQSDELIAIYQQRFQMEEPVFQNEWARLTGIKVNN